MMTKYHFTGTQNIFGVELLTSFLVSDIWFIPDGSLDPCCYYTFSHSYTFSWVTADGVVQFWSFPHFDCGQC